jgi:hypothetical protein
MKVIDCLQGSPEWFEARRGIPTASEFHRIITAKKMEFSSAATDYIAELVAERLSGLPPLGYHLRRSLMMDHGLQTEEEARRWFELDRECTVERVGFCVSDDGKCGCSPDGLIGSEGGLELKCPSGKTQVKWLLGGTLPDDYKAQVHGCLLVTGRPWWDFVSYHPGLAPLVIRVTPNGFTSALRAALGQFQDKLEQTLAFVTKRKP